MNKPMWVLLKFTAFSAIFWGAVTFENAQPRRMILLLLLFLIVLVNGSLRFFLDRERLWYCISFYLDLALIFAMEQNSRLLINYFFHSFYILILLEAVLSLEMKRGIAFGVAAVFVSLIQYGLLIYYKFNFANLSQTAFFLLVNALILIIAGFAQYNRQERQKKDLLYKELLDTHRKLKEYGDEVNRLSVIEERSRIARELHDSLGHNMTAMIMQLQMTEHFIKEDTVKAEGLLADAVKTARSSLIGIREVVETLRGEHVRKEESLAERIHWLTDEFSRKTGTSIQVEINKETGFGEDWEDLEQEVYRIIQEALTNAVRHGNAGQITVRVDYEEAMIRFLIRDNGSGTKHVKEGFGLRGIRERVEACGGDLWYGSEQGFAMEGYLRLEGNDDKDSIG